ncbi:MAG: hypothetical protein ACI9XC_001888 [Gammaproteobacteria bacterium]|jgi:hypothetical protein
MLNIGDIHMIKRLVLLITIFAVSQFVLANIATDFTNGVEAMPATEGAKAEGVLPEDAVVQLIAEGVESVEAVEIVRIVYGLTDDCGLTQEVAVAQMTETGVPQELAADVVKDRCGEGDCELTVSPIDNIITAALNTLPEDADVAPLVTLFPGCGIGGLEEEYQQVLPTPGDGNGGGPSVSPS